MYRVQSVLVYNGKAVGLRMYQEFGDTGVLQDVNITLLKGLKKSHLKPFPVEELIEHNDKLVTNRELKGGYSITDVSSDHKEVSRIQRLLLTKVEPTLLQQVTEEVFDEILRAPNIGAYVVRMYSEGFNSVSIANAKGYQKNAELKTKAKFSWNEDHEYCERHYDAWGVIDDCPVFDKWKEYAKQIAFKYMDKYPVSVNIELQGVKHELTLFVKVETDSIL